MSRAKFDSLDSYPVAAGKFWAKLDDSPPAWHPLLAHCADVAAVARCLLSPPSPLATALARTAGLTALPDDLRGRLIALAAGHDLGKVQRGFQEQALPSDVARGGFTAGHVGPLLDAMNAPHLPNLRALIINDWLPSLDPDLERALDWWILAIAHHGRPLDPITSTKAQSGAWNDAALSEAARLIHHARHWGGIPAKAAEHLPGSPAFNHLFAGLLTLADWLGSTTEAFPFCPSADDDPDAYWQDHALPQARRACAEVGLVPKTVAVSLSGLPLLKQVFPRTFVEQGHPPTALQALVAEMELPEPGARILIESSTGSGKTEAVLALYARLRAAGRVGGLMFALPTRATASSIYGRVRDALDGMYQGEPRPTVALAVGGQQPRNETDNQLLREADQFTEPEQPEGLKNWASAQSKKFLAAEIVVGTLDQVLLAGLLVNHAHLRLAALARHLLVVDELHSYDLYMAEVLQAIVDQHGRAGGVTALLSATLAEAERRRFGGGEELSRAAAAGRPYPSLCRCAPGSAWVETGLAPEERAKAVAWRLEAWDAAREAAVTAAAAGARVLLLRNTVRDLRQARCELLMAGHEALLWQPDGSEHRPGYHSRYTGPDRRWLDQRVTARFGKPAAETAGGCILLATQVAEQSLDIDFDFLVTDLCPIDVLLQRIGRLHRHSERDGHRPGDYTTPRVLAIAPPGDLATSANPGGGWGVRSVYEDLATAELTRRAIVAQETITLPAENRALIEAVYYPSSRENLEVEANWRAHLKAERLRQSTYRRTAGNVVLDFDRSYAANADKYRQFVGSEDHVRTRLGDERVRVALAEPVSNRYATDEPDEEHVDLPHWIATGETRAEAVPTDSSDPAYRIGSQSISYDEDGWHW